MSGPTPGPWAANLVRRSDGALLACHVVDANHASVAQLALHDDATVDANARLIAAAPELLAAVEAFLHYDANDEADGVQMMLDYDTALALAREALAKALGTTSNQSREM